ncbi:adenylyltransferase/cytidyltransferase family protein [Candidatus Aerophobetes bacterium]|nr:adenylyltransferase/cytidyltransferase family protein [Candidatus Aerophobetes bacterium]
MNCKSKIKTRDELKKIIQQHKKNGDIIVQCHGCFDVLHPGHIRYLQFAKSLGDILVVSITGDDFIYKGDDRPFIPEELRAEAVASLQFVDYVYLDYESWAGPILKYLKPDIYVKGKEYENIFTGRFGEERKIVESYGGKVYFGSGDVVFSSSKLVDNFKDKFGIDFERYNIFCKRNCITLDVLKNLISRFKEKRVLIIGESIVDEYNFCEVKDVAGEAPILSVIPFKTNLYVGGAGIIAKHIKCLGGEPILFSITGNDQYGEFIKSDLEKLKVKFEILTCKESITVRKVRFIAENQKLIKVDYSKPYLIDIEDEKKIIGMIRENYNNVDCIVFSDFGYGYISAYIRNEIIKFGRKKGIPIIADVSGTSTGNILKYQGIFLSTPTEREIRSALNENVSGLANIAFRFLKKTKNKNIIITLGENGLLIFKNKVYKTTQGEIHLASEYLPAIGKNVLDPMGAGDAMLATIALSVSAGGTIEQSAYLGNIVSFFEVNKIGNRPVNLKEIMDFLSLREELTGNSYSLPSTAPLVSIK